MSNSMHNPKAVNLSVNETPIQNPIRSNNTLPKRVQRPSTRCTTARRPSPTAPLLRPSTRCCPALPVGPFPRRPSTRWSPGIRPSTTCLPRIGGGRRSGGAGDGGDDVPVPDSGGDQGSSLTCRPEHAQNSQMIPRIQTIRIMIRAIVTLSLTMIHEDQSATTSLPKRSLLSFWKAPCCYNTHLSAQVDRFSTSAASCIMLSS